MSDVFMGIRVIAYKNAAGEYAILTRAPVNGEVVDVVETTPDVAKATTFLREEQARLTVAKRELLAGFKAVSVEITFGR